MSKKPIHFDLVKQATSLNSARLDEKTIISTKNLILDTLSCIIAGSSAIGIRECIEAINLLGRNNQSKVIGFNVRTSMDRAAFLNSAMGHSRDYDDTHDNSVIHSGVVILPAMLSMISPSSPGISGITFLTSFAAAVHIVNRIGLAFSSYLDTGWMPTTLFGPFGCVIGCGMLLQLSTEQILQGFGIAYSYINGNRETLTEAELTKRIQPGIASSNGVMATLLAFKGITGPKYIFDGKYGFAHLYTKGKSHEEEFAIRPDDSLEINNISLKPYPSCRCTHAVIDAVLDLIKKYSVKEKDIESGVISLTANAMGQVGHPFILTKNPIVNAQFSASYTTALTLIEGIPQLKHFDNQFILSRKDIINLANKFVTKRFKDDIFGVAPAEVVIKLKNGKEIHSKIKYPKGSPQAPMSNDEIKNKVFDCFSISQKKYPATRISKIINSVQNLENLTDMNLLIDLF